MTQLFILWLVLGQPYTSVELPPQAVPASCACLCIEGRPLTLCESIDEARGDPSLCGFTPACPLLPDSNHDGLILPELTPPEGAAGCRSVLAWDPVQRTAKRVNVCDLEAV